MNASHKKIFCCHKFVSVGLFFTLIVLAITAIIIQIFEALGNVLFTHLFLVTHIFTGLVFTILSILHAKMNWQSMKSYIKAKQSIFSREAFYALLLTVAAIFVGVLFVFIFMH